MTFARIAWRNLWKRKRMTIILVLGIAMGVFSLISYHAMVDGFMVLMINTAINLDLGHTQVHHRNYLQNDNLTLFIPEAGKLSSDLGEIPHIEGISSRVLTQGLASTVESSSFVKVHGIEPKREAAVTIIDTYLEKGEHLKPADSHGIYIGYKLAEKLKVDIGDKLVIQARDLAGDLGGAAFRVRGIFHTAAGDFDRINVFITISAAREMLALPDDGAHEIAIRVDGEEYLPGVLSELNRRIAGRGLLAETWKELDPTLYQMVEMVKSYDFLMLLIIGIAVAFGIVNSFFMEIFQRIRELGIMMALGTKPSQVFAELVWEGLFLGLLGSVTGTLFSYFVISFLMGGQLDYAMFSEGMEYMGLAGIQPLVITPRAVLKSTAGTTLIVVLAVVIPALRASRFRPVEAMRHI